MKDRSPAENEDDLLCGRLELGKDDREFPECNDDVISILPPPTTDRLRRFERSEFSVFICS